tara:strand:+ start:349 stop:510 length:162 start_codon:yes stop_codon:yes gene_type:complete
MEELGDGLIIRTEKHFTKKSDSAAGLLRKRFTKKGKKQKQKTTKSDVHTPEWI